MAELKREGKGSVDHHPVISDSDLERIYGYFNTDTPTGLFYKVQMDIRLYFFRRGSDNMHEMTVDTFCVETDSDTGIILSTLLLSLLLWISIITSCFKLYYWFYFFHSLKKNSSRPPTGTDKCVDDAMKRGSLRVGYKSRRRDTKQFRGLYQIT
jgi:hypothetical protein